MQTHTRTLMHAPARPDAEAAGPKSLLRLVPGRCTMEGESMETAALETNLLSSLLGALGTGLHIRRGVDPQGDIIAHVIWPQSGEGDFNTVKSSDIQDESISVFRRGQGEIHPNNPFYRASGDFPGGSPGKQPACQCRRCWRHGFDPWVGKIPWRWQIPWKWQPTPVFFSGKSHRQRSLAGCSP